MKNGRYTVRICSVGYQKNDAYTAFLQIPHGDSLSPAKTEELKTLADGHPESENVTEITDGEFTHTAVLRDNDVCLIILEKDD